MRISDWSSDVCSSDLLVSVELTTMTLATIFNFPWEERAKLTRWSDVTTASPETGIVESFEQRREELIECAMYFKGLWDQRIDQDRKCVVEGKSVEGRIDCGGRRIITKKTGKNRETIDKQKN